MNKMIFYINSIGHGGAERVIVQLANYFSISNEVVLVTSYRCDSEYIFNSKIKRYVLDDKIINNKFIRNFQRIIKLRKIIKKEKPVLIVSFMAEANARSIFASLGLRTKTIVSVRNDPNVEYSGFLGSFVSKLVLPMADGCVFQTEEAKKFFPNSLRKKSIILVNAVDSAFFNIDYNPNYDVITSIGRLEEQKNQKLILDAFSLIHKKYPEKELHFYGDGSLRKQLEQRAFSLGLASFVFFHGIANNIPEVLSKSGYFVLSSNYEGMPNCLMEAMAVGVPSISTNCPCGGPNYLIKDGKNGFLVECNNSYSIYEKLDILMSDKKLHRAMSLNAKNSSKEYESSVILKKWQCFLEERSGCDLK